MTQKVRQRARYSQEFKLAIVRHALSLPATARVKPTCRAFPGIEPVQIRKWIRALAPLVEKEAGWALQAVDARELHLPATASKPARVS